ncbi:response regulator [Synergistaceae bacterium OttesenSCG-928-I11]|nr:response regulator [Synergistaceae bacterium OttesenSCG-928-I11]
MIEKLSIALGRFLTELGIGIRAKLIIIFLVVKVLPLVLLTVFAWQQINELGGILRTIAVEDAAAALNDSAVENIERMTTDTAHEVAEFLYQRDDDIRYLAALEPTEENYRTFAERKMGRLIRRGEWALAADGKSWVRVDPPASPEGGGTSTNSENNDMDGFHYRQPETFSHLDVPLYDEITFVDLSGREIVKVVTNSTKVHHPMNPQRRDISQRQNTYVKAETYFPRLAELAPGDIYVSDVIGAYTPSNYIGMYTPDTVAAAAASRGYDIEYDPEAQSYAGMENPNGRRFEGIVRWATPVTDESGRVIGYATFALNHDHIMEFVDHQTPMNERYRELPSAYEGNYAFIWDYQCRSICHPRHNSIVGYDAETGDPQIPWLESSIYDAWQTSGVEKWHDFVDRENWPTFDNQSRTKKPAPALTKAGFVGLDGRYLNNAPQCTGWMDLTAEGGSGSFYILWSGLYKLTTAAAIPYYTGQYAPSEANGGSRRGFGIVTIGAGLEDFTQPATAMEARLGDEIEKKLGATFKQLMVTASILIVLVVLIAFLLASWLTASITRLIKGISRLTAGERQFRFNAPVKDEFGTLANAFDDMADSIEDSVKNSLSIIDMDHKVIYMNDQGLEFCKMTLDEVVGTSYDESSVYPSDTAYSPIKALEEGHEADVYYAEEIGRYLKPTANYFTSRDGKRLGYIVESIDVTELRKTQLELEKAIRDARLASEHKGEFLARMSHEIRTPMNAIIGLTGIIQKRLEGVEDDSPAIREIEGHIDHIESSSQHLLGLLNDILDISKIEAGKIELTEEPMTLAKLASTVDGIIKPRCEEKSIAYETTFDDFGSTVFYTDSLRLRQVLINLLGNAVKFTPEHGTIEFRMQKIEERDEETLVEFVVRDTGIGISEESISKIFQPFEQGNRKVSQQYGGTGLGLSISRSIVRLFGGDIAVNSTLGEGTVFSFQIWLKESDVAMPDKVIVSDVSGKLKGKKMLLVDDVDINRVIVASMLEDTGIEIDEAEDGLQAIKMFDASGIGEYDIIMMDIQMPHMDGYEASRSIRTLNRADADTVPIIALTANAFKDDIDKAQKYKMNGHVAKPVEESALLEALFRFLGEERSDG